MMSGVPLETFWAFSKLWNNKLYYKTSSGWYFYWVIYDARIHEYENYWTCLQYSILCMGIFSLLSIMFPFSSVEYLAEYTRTNDSWLHTAIRFSKICLSVRKLMPRYLYYYLHKRHRNVIKSKAYLFSTNESFLASPHNAFKLTVQRR
jgi:hypothetical protein